MNSHLKNFFRDEEDNNPTFIAMTRNILIVAIIINIASLPLVSGILGEETRSSIAFTTLIINLILEGISLYYVLRGKVGMAKLVVPLALIATVTTVAFNGNGLRDTSLLGFPIALIIAALLLREKAFWVITPPVIIASVVIALNDLLSGKIAEKVGVDNVIIVVFLLAGSSVLIQILTNRLNETINQLRKNEIIQIEENRELNELRQSLEERVTQRTSEFNAANNFNLRRARQFEAISQVNRVITSIQDLDTLLPRITQVISEQFNIYHTGIFLLDESREFAVLRASNSEGGKKMLARGHKLQVSQTGIVGFVTATGQPRIALDVGSDAAYFDNPDLPKTHSEIALPLRYAGQTIGALDVQSDEPNAFGQDDVEVLITLADQVSATINNTVNLENTKKALTELQSAFGESVRESWKVMSPKSVRMGFQWTNSILSPLEQHLEGDHIQDAVLKGTPILSNENNSPSSLAIPIRLHGQVVGVINLRTRNNRKLTIDDADIAEAVTERLSLAIETAILLQSTQHRADIERITTEISSKIGSSTRFETILQTAAQELSKALSGSDVLVQIEPISIELGMGN